MPNLLVKKSPFVKSPLGSTPSGPLTNGLVSFWAMNEGGGNTLFDCVGINDMTGSGNPTFGPSQYGGAPALPGVNTVYYQAPSNPTLQFNLHVPFTYAVQFMTTSSGTSSYFLSKSSNGSREYEVRITGGICQCLFGEDGSDLATVSAGTVVSNKWYLLIWYYDGTNSYASLNAGAISSVSIPGVYSSTNPLQLGIRTGVTNPFPGSIEYVGLWNRVLSQNEIQQLYANPYGSVFGSRRPLIVSESNTIVDLSVTFTGGSTLTVTLKVVVVVLVGSLTTTTIVPCINVSPTATTPVLGTGWDDTGSTGFQTGGSGIPVGAVYSSTEFDSISYDFYGTRAVFSIGGTALFGYLSDLGVNENLTGPTTIDTGTLSLGSHLGFFIVKGTDFELDSVSVTMPVGFPGTSTFSATPVTIVILSTAFAGSSTFSATPSLGNEVNLSVTFTGTSSFTATPVTIFYLATTFTGSSSFSATPSLGNEINLSATFTGASTFTATPSTAISLSVTFTGTSTVTLTIGSPNPIEIVLANYLTAQIPNLNLWAVRVPEIQGDPFDFFPVVVWSRPAATHLHSLGGSAGTCVKDFCLEIFGLQPTDTLNLATQIFLVMDGFIGQMEQFTIQSILITSDEFNDYQTLDKGDDTGVFIGELHFDVKYSEEVPAFTQS